MEAIGEYPVPAGPLAVRWLAVELPEFRAGVTATARVAVENAGLAPWRSRGAEGVQLAYHWLDDLGNPILWDGVRHAFEHPVEPGSSLERDVAVRAPIPPGRYRLAFDLVEEGRFWFAEVGNRPLERPVRVRPRIEQRALAVHGADPGALDAQDERVNWQEAEPEAVAWLAPGVVPAADWTRRVLDAHAEGYAIVGGSVEVEGSWRERRARRELAPWAPGGGRNPLFDRPLLLPSALVSVGAEPKELHGLPALEKPPDEPWLYDARIALRFRPRSGRRSV
jgi:hypothetical protein